MSQLLAIDVSTHAQFHPALRWQMRNQRVYAMHGAFVEDAKEWTIAIKKASGEWRLSEMGEERDGKVDRRSIMCGVHDSAPNIYVCRVC